LTPLSILSKHIVVLAWNAKDVFTHCVGYFLLISAISGVAGPRCVWGLNILVGWQNVWF